MRNKYFFPLIILFALNSALLRSQNDVIVLIDVSGSIDNDLFLEGKDGIQSLLLGNSIANKFIGDADNILKTGQPLIGVGNRLLLLPFGNKNKLGYLNDSKYPMEIMQKVPEDIYKEFTNYPRYPNDTRTSLHLAEVKAGFRAHKDSLSEFILITASDQNPDENTDLTTSDQNEINTWDNSSHKVDNVKIAVFKNIRDQRYCIIIQKYDISSWTSSYKKKSPPTIMDKAPKVELAKYKGGSLSEPKVAESKDIALTWFCTNCPDNVTYILNVINQNDKKAKNIRNKKLSSNSYKCELVSGTYKVTINGISSDNTTIQPAKTYIKVGGCNPIGWILFIIVLIGGGIYLINYLKKRKREILKNRSKIISS